MATTFLEPGSDADFNVGLLSDATPGFWTTNGGTPPTSDSVIVHSFHQRSIKYGGVAGGGGIYVTNQNATCADAGTRMSMYLYLVTLPADGDRSFLRFRTINNGGDVLLIKLTTAGVLKITNSAGTQLGSTGSTLSTGVWYRICISYTITNSTTNSIKLFLNGSTDITLSNVTLSSTGTSQIMLGISQTDSAMDIRTSDHYIDNSAAVTDTGDVYVTAKRPFANGTTNGFTTQIGAGGSGYGSGHSPQVNERPLSLTNGWSMIGAGSAITEEYNIENISTGDMNLTGKTIVDFIGWVCAKSALSETGSIVVGGSSSNISLTSTTTMFTKAAGSTSYPAGTGTDIGIVTATTVTTVSLYECGIIVAFIGPPTTTTLTLSHNLSLLGVGS